MRRQRILEACEWLRLWLRRFLGGPGVCTLGCRGQATLLRRDPEGGGRHSPKGSTESHAGNGCAQQAAAKEGTAFLGMHQALTFLGTPGAQSEKLRSDLEAAAALEAACKREQDLRMQLDKRHAEYQKAQVGPSVSHRHRRSLAGGLLSRLGRLALSSWCRAARCSGKVERLRERLLCCECAGGSPECSCRDSAHGGEGEAGRGRALQCQGNGRGAEEPAARQTAACGERARACTRIHKHADALVQCNLSVCLLRVGFSAAVSGAQCVHDLVAFPLRCNGPRSGRGAAEVARRGQGRGKARGRTRGGRQGSRAWPAGGSGECIYRRGVGGTARAPGQLELGVFTGQGCAHLLSDEACSLASFGGPLLCCSAFGVARERVAD
jgi:hypothetical protein